MLGRPLGDERNCQLTRNVRGLDREGDTIAAAEVDQREVALQKQGSRTDRGVVPAPGVRDSQRTGARARRRSCKLPGVVRDIRRHTGSRARRPRAGSRTVRRNLREQRRVAVRGRTRAGTPADIDGLCASPVEAVRDDRESRINYFGCQTHLLLRE